MTGPSLHQNHRDALPLPPPLSSCVGCLHAEDKVQALLDHIAGGFLRNPSRILGFDFQLLRSEPVDFSELIQRWLKRLDSDPRFPLCPDLKRRIEALLSKLLEEGAAMGSLAVARGQKRRSVPDEEAMRALLEVVKSAGLDPCDPIGIDREWRAKILRARKALFLRVDEISTLDEFPCVKKLKYLSATNGGPGSSHAKTSPKRRSQRTLLKIGNTELPRKRVPIGPSFQADIVDTTGPPSQEDKLDNSRWLGTQLWPIKIIDRRISDRTFGKTMTNNCQCTSPRSMECVRFHVSLARRQLKSQLGPAFSSLGFGEMGEDVSKSWTQEEQNIFSDIVRQNPLSEGKSFLEPALKCFTNKSREDIVSYYFNVFVLRWMSKRTRLGTWPVDSSDDEN